MLLPSSGNPFKCHEEFFLYLQPIIPPKRFDIFPSDWGMLRRSRRVLIILETTRSLVFEEKTERVSQDTVMSGQTCFQENLNASRPSEYPPVRGENVKTFRWDHRLQIIQTSSWHLNGFPDGSNIVGSTNNTGEKPTVILYTYINRHAGTLRRSRRVLVFLETSDKEQKPNRNNTVQHPTCMVVIIYCFIGI